MGKSKDQFLHLRQSRKEQRHYSVQDVINAEINLEPCGGYYLLIEDSPSGKTIIGEFHDIEKAKISKLHNESYDDANGGFCNYFITKYI